ncbi:MAG: malate synthase A [Desulfobacteraceae bacterium]|jgi:malate synthase|nr:malate synthase A [Desulfobacteraceae bacterium]
MSHTRIPDGVTINAPVTDAFASILTPDALRFVSTLARRFDTRRRELIARRETVQAEIDAGNLPDFLPDTKPIRDGDWTVAPVPDDLSDRRVEITGPVDRKMVINALNSGAKTYMADFEDSHSPTWTNTIEGQRNLRDAVNRTIEFTSPEGKTYRLNDTTATLIVRPRGWHLVEKHVLVDGQPVSGSLFDFGLFFFHNARRLLERGSGPYFYLPKMESHLEARLWNDVFIAAQEALDIPTGTIKATVLIETIMAAFEMDEILYELKDHSAGLNCGRWDYIFSFIKRFKKVPGYLFPDRSQITMTRHCMRSYSLLAIKTCHRRGAYAVGGMAAQIPIKSDPEKNREALGKVRADKTREATDGHDGTWVAHPGLVSIAMEEFDKAMPAPSQIDRVRKDVHVTAADLLKVPAGTITEQGMRTNISVGIQYMANWLSGLGCVPLYNLMEDAATAEISRAQLWQWINHPDAALDDGRKITLDLFRSMMKEEMEKIRAEVGDTQFQQVKYDSAATLFDEIIAADDLAEFLTLKAYDHLEG